MKIDWIRYTAVPLLLLAIFAGPVAPSSDGGRMRQLITRVVKVEAANGDGSVSIGSGVLVGRGLVATNCHVTRSAASIVLVRGGTRSTVESQSSDVEHDLCLLRSSEVEDAPAATVTTDPPQTGQAVVAVGFIGGIAPRVSSGEINAIYNYDGGNVIETSAWFASGASGGGLFDDQGRLLGIISFMSRGPQTRHYCLPAAWVAWAAEHYDGQPVGPLNGRPFWQQEEEQQPYFLRAASLEASGNWAALADLARDWSDAESRNASSWFALGTAYAHLDRPVRSIAAYEAAVAIDAGFSRAWYGLALAYARSCQLMEVDVIRAVLAKLDSRLAEALERREESCTSPAQSTVGG